MSTIGRSLAESIVVFTAVKTAGALYLMYLGGQAIRHRHGHAALPSDQAQLTSSGRQLCQRIAVGATNPKTLVFFIGVLPQFVGRDASSVPLQLAVLGCLFAAIAVCCDSVRALIAGTARTWFGATPAVCSRWAPEGAA